MDTSTWGHASEAPSNLSPAQAGASSAPTALDPDLSGSCSAGTDTLPLHEEPDPFEKSRHVRGVT